MKFSNSFIKTNKQKKIENSFDLVLKAGLVHKYSAGSYGYTPLGQRVLDRIVNICNNNLQQSGALKFSAPLIQSADLWIQSGRWGIYGNEMLKMKNRENQQFCAAPTHEEAITDLVSSLITSYKDLPFTLYQIGTKYRDELRPRHGLLRTREFLMLDAYSFDLDEDGLTNSYSIMKKAFQKIFNDMSLDTIISNADTGEVGGSFSEEFLAPATYGEDEISISGKTVKGIEVGHIFKLGTRYSDSMNLNVNMPGEKITPLIMGCYGVGVSRLIPSIIDQNHDDKGIIWPTSVSPYDVEIIPLGNDNSVIQLADNLETQFRNKGVECLVDDRDVSPGYKFKDADLIGIPYKIIIGNNYIKNREVEVENRKTGNKENITPNKLFERYNLV